MSAPAKALGEQGTVVALCGGVGGAKLAFGLSHLLGERLTVIVNTGDDFEHLGLHISPDIDTVLYTLSDRANRELGWGRKDESWNFMKALAEIGGEGWFQLGDRDLALHVERTRRMRAGDRLTDIVVDFARRFAIPSRILPMSDDAVRTSVVTRDEGVLPFQRYFVERRCQPVVEEVQFQGADSARMSAEVEAALSSADLRAVIVCPSNPYLSIDPLLSVPGISQLLADASAPVVAVSPIIGGQAVKGPTAKIMSELGIPATNATIADHYGDLIDGLMIDEADAAEIGQLAVRATISATLMRTDDDRCRLAEDVLAFAETLAETGSGRRP
ncbi:2-phospho-L-lactate transferase [Pseudohoeflea suaedae]|uniref:2-phospho-L-lactate transferase n=1 Tax=Pseudohoeflea suaedae TaxID=877384 RepID=A0A4R5PIU9_9HYPH|nr:2-phospho-L-lactate transferase [Pseudohoeflea suaedae]TDH35169.1 2-phospho-L-lactate transferase [Pseudohoeflea suaedae]